MVMGTQEDIDKRIETRLNAVYDTVRFLGEEIQSLKLRTKIRCHSDYHWICVTPKEYNISETSWNRVQRHLEGIWSNSNLSLDLLRLHQEIIKIGETPHAKLTVAQLAENFVNSLFSHFPSLTHAWYAVGTIIGVLVVIVLFMCFLPCAIKIILAEVYKLRAIIRNHQLINRSKLRERP